MIRVLLAIDGTDLDDALVESVRNLFADDAEYWAVNVQPPEANRDGPPGVAPGAPLPAYGVPYPVELVHPGGPAPSAQWVERTDTGEHVQTRARGEAESLLHDHQLPRAHAVGASDDDPADVIVRESRARDIDVVVVGSHGRGWLSRLLRTPVSEQVLEKSPAPVLVVGTDVDVASDD